jgi:mannonate dehydratase
MSCSRFGRYTQYQPESFVNRREFLAASAAAPAVEAAQNATAPNKREKTPTKFLMKLGMQDHMSDDDLAYYSSVGVEEVCTSLPSKRLDERWSVEALVKERERVESYGVKLVMMPLPLSSVEIDKAEYPNIMLGKSPERDRDIDDICQMIRNTAKAGIPALKYNMSILGIVRTDPVKGRGSSSAHAFHYDKAIQEPPLTAAGRVTEEMAWERITYFLKRVIPVAEEYKVRMACHPHDPGMPRGIGFRGVERVLGSVDGLKRFIEIAPSQYHGLNFCQGTVSEMLKEPAKEVFDVIRYFGARRKIFNVHFRNIKGGFLNFQEAFPDEGDVDMAQAMRVYKEVGYDGMIMPDHLPTIPGDPGDYTGGPKGFGFALGYMRGIMQMVAAEG